MKFFFKIQITKVSYHCLSISPLLWLILLLLLLIFIYKNKKYLHTNEIISVTIIIIIFINDHYQSIDSFYIIFLKKTNYLLFAFFFAYRAYRLLPHTCGKYYCYTYAHIYRSYYTYILISNIPIKYLLVIYYNICMSTITQSYRSMIYWLVID